MRNALRNITRTIENLEISGKEEINHYDNTVHCFCAKTPSLKLYITFNLFRQKSFIFCGFQMREREKVFSRIYALLLRCFSQC